MPTPAHPPGGTSDAPTWTDRRADAAAAVARLRQSWAWLDELRVPGPETSAGRVLTDAARARQAAEAAADRAERHNALAAAPAPVRLAIVDLQTYLGGRVQRIADRVARTTHQIVARGVRRVPELLGWLDVVDPGGPWIASATGVTGRAAGFDLAPGGTLAWAVEQLGHVDELARQAAGVVGDRVAPLPDRCPACRRKSLQLTYTGDDRRTWAVVCASVSCLCTGTGCPCRAAVRYAGRRHAWAYGELDGRSGLWAAIAAARRSRPPIRHTKTGHGGRL